MKRAKFECEVVTPMFLAGADGVTPELRPPSLKGMIRFWWRAMQGDMALSKLKEKEATLFGGTGEDYGRSSVLLRVSPTGISDSQLEKNLSTVIGADFPGIKYLLYSMFMFKNSIRPYIKPGVKFTVHLKARDIKPLRQATQAFLFLSFFGAIGSRARRGGGNFRIFNSDQPHFIDPSNIESASGLKKYFERYLTPHASFEKTDDKPDFSSLAGARIFIFSPENSWKNALERIGFPFQEFRHENKGRVTETPNFGFPVSHKDGSRFLGGKAKSKGQKKTKDRRASTLIFRVVKVNKNTYFPLLIWLGGKFLPKNYEIINVKGREHAHPDDSIIQEFIDEVNPKEEVST